MLRINRNSVSPAFLKEVDAFHEALTGEKLSAVWARSRSNSVSSTERRASTTSSEPRSFDSDRYSDFEFSSDSRSSTSSMGSSRWFDGDRKESMSVSEYETTSAKESSPARVSPSDTGSLRSLDDSAGVEVVAHGTKLMAHVGYPTVLIKMQSKKLRSSQLYYVVLEPVSGPYLKDIVCVMLSSPHNSEKAELLPLHPVRSNKGAVSLVPMLLEQWSRSYRSLFAQGCTFKVKSMKRGRRLDRKTRKWRNYDLGRWEIHDLLRRLISLDISEIPTHMVPPLTKRRAAVQVSKTNAAVKPSPSPSPPLKEKTSSVFSPSTKLSSLYADPNPSPRPPLKQKTSSNPSPRPPLKQKTSSNPSPCPSLKEKTSSVLSPICKLSSLHPDLKFRGVTASGGSTFASWFKVLPAHVHVDKDFRCDRRTELGQDSFANMAEFDEYLCIADTI